MIYSWDNRDVVSVHTEKLWAFLRHLNHWQCRILGNWEFWTNKIVYIAFECLLIFKQTTPTTNNKTAIVAAVATPDRCGCYCSNANTPLQVVLVLTLQNDPKIEPSSGRLPENSSNNDLYYGFSVSFNLTRSTCS